MNPPKATAVEPLLKEPPDFSLVLGGPLYQLWRRTHLAGDALELLRRRVVATVLLAWLPLLVLSVVEGHAWGDAVKVPFLFDIDAHARYLLALPLLIVAELVVHQRLRLVVRQFLDRGLIGDAARAKFDAALASAMRLRNSIMGEALLLAFVYLVGVMIIWRHHMSLEVPTWYGAMVEGQFHPTVAGWWYGCLSLPLFQFILFRWYLRLCIWGRFLWQVSRIDLNLVPTHPDRAGGLGFLANASHAFAPLMLAQGVLLAGLIANHIFFAGGKLPQFKMELIALVALAIFFVLGPLLVFIPLLAGVKRRGLSEYGALAQRYVRGFDQKWLRGGAPADEPLVGSADIQSLADLGSSYEAVKDMRLVPFTKGTVLQLAVMTLLPAAPLVLTMIPLGELLNRLLKLVF